MNHEFFMLQALELAAKALEKGEFPVGCVIEYQGDVVATGRRNNSLNKVNELDHGEMMALRTLLKEQPEIDMAGVTVYSTMEPCLMCFSTLLVNGVRRFVYSYEDAMGGGTNLPLSMLSPLYRDMAITVVKNILRESSLKLFQDFFSLSGNGYLKGSLLAEYTLQQKIG